MAVIPNSNVNLATNIRDVLNAAGGSVTNDVTTFFKPEAKINPFSKHKPVVLNTNFCQDFDSSKPNYVPNWWEGSLLDCGITYTAVINVDQIPDKYDDDMNGWSYRLPTGGVNEPFRLGDFCGYSSDAKPMVYDFEADQTSVGSESGQSITFGCKYSTKNENSLTMSDFPNLSGYYFGVLIVHSNGTNQKWLTSDSNVSNGGYSVNISTYGLRAGTWSAYPILSSVKRANETDIEVAGSFYTFPKAKKITFTVSSSSISITVVCWYNTNAAGMNTSITIDSITVKGTAGTTFKNNGVRIRFASKKFDDALDVDDVTYSLDDFTMPSSGTYSFPLTFAQKNITLPDYLEDYLVWVSLGSASYKNSFEPSRQ